MNPLQPRHVPVNVADAPSNHMDVFGATFKETWALGTGGIDRLGDVISAKGRTRVTGESDVPAYSPTTGEYMGTRTEEVRELIDRDQNPVITKQEILQRYPGIYGDKDIPEYGMTEKHLALDLKNKQEQAARLTVMERGPGGVSQFTTSLGASLVASIIDPINIAASLMPVGGQAAFAANLAKTAGTLSRAGLRAARGFKAGVVGSATVEPAMYLMAQENGYHYTVTDSMVNVMMGGLVGAGLHAGGGAIKDRFTVPRIDGPDDLGAVPDRIPVRAAEVIDMLPPEARLHTSRAALQLALEGRSIDIERLFAEQLDLVMPGVNNRRQAMDATKADLVAASSDRLPMDANERQRLEAERSALEQEYLFQPDDSLDAPKMERRISQLDSLLAEDDARLSLQEEINDLNGGLVPERLKAQIDQRAKDIASQQDPDGFQRTALSQAVSRNLGTDQASRTMDFLRSPETIAGYSRALDEEVDILLQSNRIDDIDALLTESVDDLAVFDRSNGTNLREQLADADELIRTVKRDEEAFMAFLHCRIA